MVDRNLKTTARWLRANVELRTLVSLALAICAVWAFAELADEVIEGTTRNLDRDVLLMLREPGSLDDPLGPAWVEEVMRDLTALGGVAVLTLTLVAVAGFFMLRKRFGSTAYLFAAVGGGLLISTVAKELFDRPRPDLVTHGSYVHTASFPSGHSMMAAVVYLTLGVLISRVLPQRRQKTYVLAIAVLVTVLVGISRVYLGVHWPTDVLAGWLAGLAWAFICVLGARALARRGHVEAEADEAGESSEPVASARR